MKYSAEKYEEVSMDPRFMDIGGLPSNFKGYGFTNMLIRPFSVQELKLISRAVALNESQHIIRAIDLTITEDINDITIGDYFYLLMWQKIHSYPKTPILVDWMCREKIYKDAKDDSKVFRELTAEQLAVPPEEFNKRFTQISCDTSNTQSITMTNVEIMSLEDDFKLPEGLDFPRVRIMDQLNQMLEDPELAFLIPAVQWMPGTTLDDKLKQFEDSGDMDLFRVASQANKDVVHGVKQTTHITCRRCRASHPYKIELDPLSFFQ